jgi:hypothetical protein
MLHILARINHPAQIKNILVHAKHTHTQSKMTHKDTRIPITKKLPTEI